MGGRPVFILSDDAERTTGRDAQTSNIAAGKAVSEAVRTTLGPRGMDKMLVSDTGDVTITNDGATILETMDIEHPAAQMIVEVAAAQEEEVGDGTTTAAVLAGELLSKAEDLLDDDVHPTTIVEGYARARDIALEAVDDGVLDEELDDDLLRTVAESSMTGKGTGDVTTERLAEVVVDAIRHVEDDEGVARDDVRVHTQTGSSSSATELVAGVISDAEPAHANMPREVAEATVAVVDEKLGVRETEIDAEYSVESVDQLTAAMDAEERELRGYADALADAGVDVAFVTESVEDRVAAHLADAGILAFEDVDDDEARAIASATGASRTGDVDDLEDADLGRVDAVRVRSFGDEDLAFVEGGAAAEAVTVLVRGGTEHVVDELERALADALDVVTAALDEGGVVPGAGATEITVADRVREAAAGIEGREQLAVEAFADAVDVLPRTLAANTGMDPIDGLVDLRSANEEDPGRAGIIATGQHGEVGDPVEAGVLDPAAVKREAIESATEAATMIARIDDVIAAE
ncbi:thermosome subunit [Halorussus salilacus]|uniref:thermosome subunit alpha n=1 Tax=Halorussus salilacus TaxID=2953750 RepID=UPI00209CA357|nr:thermosome subunit alpha [Halorussus salilacus]USZ68953.1 thermosome subunit [Halorussus salilacus]